MCLVNFLSIVYVIITLLLIAYDMNMLSFDCLWDDYVIIYCLWKLIDLFMLLNNIDYVCYNYISFKSLIRKGLLVYYCIARYN